MCFSVWDYTEIVKLHKISLFRYRFQIWTKSQINYNLRSIIYFIYKPKPEIYKTMSYTEETFFLCLLEKRRYRPTYAEAISVIMQARYLQFDKLFSNDRDCCKIHHLLSELLYPWLNIFRLKKSKSFVEFFDGIIVYWTVRKNPFKISQIYTYL